MNLLQGLVLLCLIGCAGGEPAAVLGGDDAEPVALPQAGHCEIQVGCNVCCLPGVCCATCGDEPGTSACAWGGD